MQGAPGCALDGFIRNTVVDLCDIKTIQGRASTPDPPPFARHSNIWVRGGRNKIAASAPALAISLVTVPFPPKDAPPMQHMLEWTFAPQKMGRHSSQCRLARMFPSDPCSSVLKDVRQGWDPRYPEIELFLSAEGPWQLRWAALVWLSLSITLRESRAGKLGRNILHCLPFCRSLIHAWLVFCERRSPGVDKIPPTRRFSLPG